MRLGEALVAAGTITEEELSRALTIQANSGAKLGEILVSLGYLHYLQLYGVLAPLLGLRL